MNEKKTQYLSFTGTVELGPSHDVVRIAEGYMVDALASRAPRDWSEAEREAVEAFALSLIDGFDTEVARSDGSYLRRSLTPCALGAGDEFIYVVRVPGEWCEWAIVTPECADEIRNALF